MHSSKCLLLAGLLLAACSPPSDSSGDDAGPDAAPAVDSGAPEDVRSDADASDATVGPTEPVLIRNFGEYELDGGEEAEPCVQWSFDNAKPLYVNTVTMSNDGYYHHSNWLVVPDTAFPGKDGFFDCDERGYSEVNAAVQGTVLFAQSTQAREEVQDLPDGVVVKIPPFHKVIAGAHLLNISPNPVTTELRMKLDLLHPADVETIVTGFRLSYYDLNIQPEGETRVTAECNLKEAFEDFTGEPFEMKLYWVLPHYHELGNYFRLDVLGGPRDGETLFELEGFNAEANGQSFSPPVDFTGATGLRFSCGWNNPRDETVGWGIGDQEMCVMLGLADASALFDAAVTEGDMAAGTDAEGRALREGPCEVTMIPKNASQSMPSEDELESPLYVPSSDAAENNTTVIPECEDTPEDASPTLPATLSSIQDSVFLPGCTFSSCHDAVNPAFGLDLKSDGLHQRLMNHEVQHDTDLPLVEPGDASDSWLYRIVSECNPSAGGTEVAHMPRNSPDLMDPGFVAMVRDWIDAGAADD